jgi:hypothetical protein
VWASYDRSRQIHTSSFVDFLIPFYELLPTLCRVATEDSFGQIIEKTQLDLRSGALDSPEFSVLVADLKPPSSFDQFSL